MMTLFLQESQFDNTVWTKVCGRCDASSALIPDRGVHILLTILWIDINSICWIQTRNLFPVQ